MGVFVNNRAQEADALEKARDAEADPAKRAELDAQLIEAPMWGPGGDYRRIASAITAAAGGNVMGSAAEMAKVATVNYLQGLGATQVKALGEHLDPASKAALHAIVGCAGAALQGSSERRVSQHFPGVSPKILHSISDPGKRTGIQLEFGSCACETSVAIGVSTTLKDTCAHQIVCADRTE
ncbi:hemagglutinin-related protein [Pandoraea terrae]|uniref:Hemagglutinin-related protein n=1 Tax=Pandoraea terrae TaxID=1537710 RepID=A0A5E4SWU0_9BURK|nr:hemagglutinin-related protein [Pandoraea terrae]